MRSPAGDSLQFVAKEEEAGGHDQAVSGVGDDHGEEEGEREEHDHGRVPEAVAGHHIEGDEVFADFQWFGVVQEGGRLVFGRGHFQLDGEAFLTSVFR